MPWIIMPNGEKKYKLSIYAKEELPTWSEVYNEYYLPGNEVYDPNDEDCTQLDPYWKIPRRKVLLATVCNEFNKMLYEDGYRERILSYLNAGYAKWGEIIDIKFILEPLPYLWEFMKADMTDEEKEEEYNRHMIRWNDFINKKFIGLNCAPPIYTIPHPKGWKNPFIIRDYNRIDITTLDGRLMLYPILRSESGGGNSTIEAFYPTDTDEGFIRDRKRIIDLIMKQFWEYFEDGIGWKDKNGNLVQSVQSSHPRLDPAL